MTIDAAQAALRQRPLILSDGRPLQAHLETEIGMDPWTAADAIRHYERFLILALTAPPGEATLPGREAQEVWRMHRDDALAWALYCEGLDAAKLTLHRAPNGTFLRQAAKATRGRYIDTFVPDALSWWPNRLPGWQDFRRAGAGAKLRLLVLIAVFNAVLWRWAFPGARLGEVITLILTYPIIFKPGDGLFDWTGRENRRWLRKGADVYASAKEVLP